MPNLPTTVADLDQLITDQVQESLHVDSIENVVFEFSEELRPWIEKQQAKLFTTGIKYFPPKGIYSFMYGLLNALVHKNSNPPASFDVTVSYEHPSLGRRVSDCFHINLMDYWGSSLLETEIYEHGKELKESIKELTKEAVKLNSHISKLAPLADPTGVALSVTTLRNLRRLRSDEDFEKIDPTYLDYDIFMEVLGIDSNTALQLRDFFGETLLRN